MPVDFVTPTVLCLLAVFGPPVAMAVSRRAYVWFLMAEILVVAVVLFRGPGLVSSVLTNPTDNGWLGVVAGVVLIGPHLVAVGIDDMRPAKDRSADADGHVE